MMQRSWYILDNRNDSSKECFAISGIKEPYKPVWLLYTPGF